MESTDTSVSDEEVPLNNITTGSDVIREDLIKAVCNEEEIDIAGMDEFLHPKAKKKGTAGKEFERLLKNAEESEQEESTQVMQKGNQQKIQKKQKMQREKLIANKRGLDQPVNPGAKVQPRKRKALESGQEVVKKKMRMPVPVSDTQSHSAQGTSYNTSAGAYSVYDNMVNMKGIVAPNTSTHCSVPNPEVKAPRLRKCVSPVPPMPVSGTSESSDVPMHQIVTSAAISSKRSNFIDAVSVINTRCNIVNSNQRVFPAHDMPMSQYLQSEESTTYLHSSTDVIFVTSQYLPAPCIEEPSIHQGNNFTKQENKVKKKHIAEGTRKKLRKKLRPNEMENSTEVCETRADALPKFSVLLPEDPD